jgi:tetratricopeptide (TPR) repeat protein
MTQNNLGNALSEQGMGTAGTDGVRLLSEAVAAYRQALQVYTREPLPQDWAMTQNNIGTALQEQSTRTEGTEAVRLLSEAVAAYRQALQVYTREQLPQLWAATQNNLGNALQSQGTKTEGVESVRLLSEAVAAYRLALQVYTREQLPQDWAMTQNNLGAALREQGTRTSGGEGLGLLSEAVAANWLALQIYTREQLPEQWASAQNNLAQAFLYLKDSANAAQCYVNVLQVYPRSRTAYEKADFLEHEVLFNYQLAFNLNQSWLRTNPNDLSALSEFAEKHFTTGRFGQSEQRISSLLVEEKLAARTKIALRAIQIANLIALNQSHEVPARMNELMESVSKQTADFKLAWSFEGIKHFIRQNQQFATRKDWLIMLFTALAAQNREQILAGLRAAFDGFPQRGSLNIRLRYPEHIGIVPGITAVSQLVKTDRILGDHMQSRNAENPNKNGHKETRQNLREKPRLDCKTFIHRFDSDRRLQLSSITTFNFPSA